MDQGEDKLACWACRSFIELAPELTSDSSFRCSLCGAINEPARSRHKSSRQAQVHVLLTRTAGLLFVAFALMLITGICYYGVRDVLPMATSTRTGYAMSVAVSITLDGIVVFTYLLAVLADPGNPRKIKHLWHHRSQQDSMHLGQYYDMRYCYKCQQVKPPKAHHCRTCQQCVLELDHHCPFTNNCVGMDTYRHFLVFLFWAMLGTLYAACVCVFTFAVRLNETKSLMRFVVLQKNRYEALAQSRQKLWSAMLVRLRASILALLKSPAWASSAIVIFVTSLLVFGLLLALFTSQIKFAASGSTYIDNLQGNQGTTSVRSLPMQNLRTIFGNVPMPLWVIPRMRPPAGAKSTVALSKSE